LGVENLFLNTLALSKGPTRSRCNENMPLCLDDQSFFLLL